jgi:cell division protein FtsL
MSTATTWPGSRRAGTLSWRTSSRPRPAVLALAAGLCLCGLALAVYVWCKLQCFEEGYAISRAAKERASLMELNRTLQVELARASSLGRVEAIASGKLGLIFPGPGQVRRLGDGQGEVKAQ